MNSLNPLRTTIAALALAALLTNSSAAQTITDNFTDPSKWSAPYAAPGKNIGIAGGRMHSTSATLDSGGAGVARNDPLLSLAQNWSLQVDVHIDPFTLTAVNQYADIFLGFGKTGDWFNTHVIFEFDRGWWSSASDYDIGDDVRINGVDAPGLFNASGLTSPDAALRLDYEAVSHLLTYRFDADGAANGYNWTVEGTANLTTGTYNLNLGPADTLNVLLFGSSEGLLVSSGQAYFSNLQITITQPPPPFTWTTNNGTITITDYTGSGGAVSIPASINGLSVTAIGDSAFNSDTTVTSVTIPDSVVSVGDQAFYLCTGLAGAYFSGNAPAVGTQVFTGDTAARVYYLPGTLGWGSSFGDRPTALWVLPYPVILTTAPNFGIKTNAFGFVISWATNANVVVETSANPAVPGWVSRSTNALINGTFYFSDRNWTYYPTRFYRVRSP